MNIGRDKPKFKIKNLVQLLNPRTKRYVLVDKSVGKILAHKSDGQPYKNIPVPKPPRFYNFYNT